MSEGRPGSPSKTKEILMMEVPPYDYSYEFYMDYLIVIQHHRLQLLHFYFNINSLFLDKRISRLSIEFTN